MTTFYKSAYSIFVPLEYIEKREIEIIIKKLTISPLFMGKEIMRRLNSILFVYLDLLLPLSESLLFTS